MAYSIPSDGKLLLKNPDILVDILKQMADLLNELRTDHATTKTAVDGIETLVEEIKADETGLLDIGTLAISGTATKFKTTTTANYRVAGTQCTKAATDNLTFTAADTINTGTATGSFFGAWLVQINAAGTISTKSVGADQAYTSSALALAALPAVDTGNVKLGHIVINANANSAWTANTDDMTNGSDCVTAVFADAAVTAEIATANPSSGPASISAAAISY